MGWIDLHPLMDIVMALIVVEELPLSFGRKFLPQRLALS
jgi:hypothetical protein